MIGRRRKRSPVGRNIARRESASAEVGDAVPVAGERGHVAQHGRDPVLNLLSLAEVRGCRASRRRDALRFWRLAGDDAGQPLADLDHANEVGAARVEPVYRGDRVEYGPAEAAAETMQRQASVAVANGQARRSLTVPDAARLKGAAVSTQAVEAEEAGVAQLGLHLGRTLGERYPGGHGAALGSRQAFDNADSIDQKGVGVPLDASAR